MWELSYQCLPKESRPAGDQEEVFEVRLESGKLN